MNAVNGHTPGPWKYRVHMNTHGGWKPPEQVVEVWGGKQLIAYYSTSSDEFPGDAESEANARLMAAAPIYYAATDVLLEVAERGVINDPEGFGRAIRMFREAHAKATGASA